MGCISSQQVRLNDFKERLAHAEHDISENTAAISADFELFRGTVVDLAEISEFFCREINGQDSDAVARVQKLGRSLTQKLVDLLDIQLFRRGDHLRVQGILQLAQSLEHVSGSQAVQSIEEKRKELYGTLVMDSVVAITKAVQGISGPDSLIAKSREVLAQVQKAQDYVKVRDDKIDPLLRECSLFTVKALSLVGQVLAKGESSMSVLESIASKLDSLCATLAGVLKAQWEPLLPKLKVEYDKFAAAKLPVLLDAAEAELAKEKGFSHVALLGHLKAVNGLWAGHGDDQAARMKSISDHIEARVSEAFDRALAAGKQDASRELMKFTTEYQDIRDSMLGKSEDSKSLVRKLNQKNAGVTLQSMLKGFETNAEEQRHTLHAAYEEADAAVKRIPREHYAKTEVAKWFFKTRKEFKEYSAEKSREVEKHYQEWVAKGRPSGPSHRCEITIAVGKQRPSVHKSTQGRALCQYGDKCYRKNPEHLRDFCHPGDDDFPPPDAEGEIKDLDSLPTKEERFSLDFHLMTQVNLSIKGMRPIQRKEGQTLLSKTTQPYFDQVIEFAKEIETTTSNAERELRLLGQEERDQTQKDLEELLKAAGPPIVEFLQLAVYIRETKVIDEVLALLGTTSESLRLGDMLKELRLSDVIDELTKAFVEKTKVLPREGARWTVVRSLFWGRLLRPRYGFAKRREERSNLVRRRAQMRCQALLSSYDSDEPFKEKLRNAASDILILAVQQSVQNNDSTMMLDVLRAAMSLQCEPRSLMEHVRALVCRCIKGACTSQYQSLTDAMGALDVRRQASAVLGVAPEEVLDLSTLIDVLSSRAMWDTPHGAPFPKFQQSQLAVTVAFRSKLGPSMPAFDESFWKRFQQSYDSMIAALMAESSPQAEERKSAAIEWAIALCEQTKQAMPKWMMTKDQVEALQRLKKAIEQKDEKALREAVIFAKQADYKSDLQLSQAYEESVEALKKMKRLPSGWLVDDLVGDKLADAGMKMFAQVVVSDGNLKVLFQKIFDQTTEAKLTRDRITRGGDHVVPRGYRVERIETVMNAESWACYLTRRDAIAAKCKSMPGSAPCPDITWQSWNGAVATAAASQELLEHCRLPPLESTSNEFLMFHGTKAEAAAAIARNHFDMAFACKTGMFGAGLYFAESCSKSDEYVTPSKMPDGREQFPMVLCRVSLGRIHYCAAADPTTDPGRAKLEGACIGGEYHSVLGDRKRVKGTYREFIVYDHWQVYPAFVIWYSRL